ncbi:amidohydrolase family protein [Roseisolibacter sp. H3M3-2]|uniref:amidohydrolase family protein n=1 Tax=Roseisolibacter sp. H3M3-2 TaxID=3031323 RepID=UPI0023DA6848|nr:amidohydrolase family protein [Roseisolibacter sp. H3M3-2]MDF1504523.1 amidohydrolase family protein [Roseisolibacter sp. H3M3-2]
MPTLRPLAAALALTTAPLAAQAPAVTAFVGATVLPMDGRAPQADQTVVVRGDRIVAVGPSARTAVPAGATRVEARGRWIVPGLAEMHGHVPPPNAPAVLTDETLFLYVANGITTVRGMLGAPGQLALRERANKGEVIAPTLYLAGPSFNGNSVNSPEQAEQMVKAQKAEGWDLLKVHPGLTRPEYDAMARTAKAERIRFGGHVPAEVGLLHALEMGQETFDHIDGYIEQLQGDQRDLDAAAMADVIKKTRDAGAWIVPTMALWEVLYGTADVATVTAYPELRYMPKNTVAQWTNLHTQRMNSPQMDRAAGRRVIDNRMKLLKAMSDAGVKILMGTDAPQQFSVPGFSLHRELLRMREAGMTPEQILATGTRRVGEYFAGSDKFGTIAAGQRADLLLLTADPLADIGNLTKRAGVMVRGRWLSEDDIQKRLAEIAARHAQ